MSQASGPPRSTWVFTVSAPTPGSCGSLSGPQYPAATLTFVAVYANGETDAMSVPPQKPPNTLERGPNDFLGLLLKPGDYHIYFSQRFPRSKGPGFDVAFTILTTP